MRMLTCRIFNDVFTSISINLSTTCTTYIHHITRNKRHARKGRGTRACLRDAEEVDDFLPET